MLFASHYHTSFMSSAANIPVHSFDSYCQNTNQIYTSTENTKRTFRSPGERQLFFYVFRNKIFVFKKFLYVLFYIILVELDFMFNYILHAFKFLFLLYKLLSRNVFIYSRINNGYRYVFKC